MSSPDVVSQLNARFGPAILGEQATHDAFPTLWIANDATPAVHHFLKHEIDRPFRMLADLWAIDETARQHREGQPRSGVTIASHLISHDRNADIRLKVPLEADYPRAQSIGGVFPNADWYEREAFDMFGVEFVGRPHRLRILLPPGWEGHPMRKDQPGRATERAPFNMTAALFDAKEHALAASPEAFGLPTQRDGVELMILNYGPHSMATHGVFRIVLALDGEEIVAARPDIGFHHRGAEKMAERQNWHSFLPYTDRVDYLGGVMGELPYLQAVEKLCGIKVPDRAKMVRVMLSEFFRIMNHLLFYGTMAQDTGAMSPVFYMFTDREHAYRVIEAITGARMHPCFFRIGGLSMDLPTGWEQMVRDFLDWMPSRLDDYDGMVLRNEIFRARTIGIAEYDTAMALDWGVTGPGLRATGLGWDLRKARPYCGFEQFDFEVPTGVRGDCFDRTVVRVEEIRQSLRIIRQCVDNMPAGPIKADHPLTTPPPRERMQHDIETMIHHFVGTSWGPVVPAGEATGQVETVRGLTQFSLISDGEPASYRTRIRTPSFPHLQMISAVAPGMMVADLVAYLGSIDYVMSDVDR
ncbi:MULTISPECIES: NADH-quinone oxidoreductase subunit C/D [Rhodopseudomonas]|uniref:NADH-quinone oxidoreductase subunit C/D n=1 Tax=Rhodopseudomonas palustris TaxID=1076 RepID=A0A0D7F311_RHOPL|nr:MULTISPECIES: NADH-quinone oxidoreductase subunit C/D [Rhodopseudomonas]KIZ47478.1 NADH:ubiquinone oxidoreductase [Rhodopseudomonas palustris]MDF3813868.1 NADH-quinone oxidoreductase subunit C/D [Rhodopseudomonas sp. BAL398]WOK15459.1 NADH-quinone oxidoreductase subunit C/D [Rhodopseudomonas sp. BAL398]